MWSGRSLALIRVIRGQLNCSGSEQRCASSSQHVILKPVNRRPYIFPFPSARFALKTDGRIGFPVCG